MLGDDIVIFDKNVYDNYILLLEALGLPANPSKSIPASSVPFFEFAKRTVLNAVDVSPLSWRELLNCNSIAGRVNLALRLGSRNVISGLSGLKACVAANPGDLHSQNLSKSAIHSLFGILGSIAVNSDSDSTLDTAVSLLANPDLSQEEEFKPNVVCIPEYQSLRVANSLLQNNEATSLISHYDDRLEIVREELLPFMSESSYLTALHLSKKYVEEIDSSIDFFAAGCISNGVTDRVLLAQIRSIYDDMFIGSSDPSDLIDEVEAKVYKAAKYGMPLRKAILLLEEVTAKYSSISTEVGHRDKTISTRSWITVLAAKAGYPGSRYWRSVPQYCLPQ